MLMPMMDSYPSYLAVVLTLLGAVVVCGCMAAGGEDRPADRISGNGTITYVDLEGGFYGIVADDGTHYLPADLPEEYRTDGLRVAFSADPADDGVGTQMWGTPVEIRSIERINGVLLVSGNATVTYIDLEGGFYGLVTDDGRHYLPLGLDETWRVDGTNVTFVARVNDVDTVQQWGVPVEVIAIDTAGNATYVAETGTVAYIDLEGGFYGIIADDGMHYLPLGLEERYRVDGMRLTFAGEVSRDVMTVQQWGTPVEIIAVPWACARCGESVVGIANPAAVWCKEQGYAYEIRQNPDGSEYGVCIFENGTEVDAWDYYRQTH